MKFYRKCLKHLVLRFQQNTCGLIYDKDKSISSNNSEAFTYLHKLYFSRSPPRKYAGNENLINTQYITKRVKVPRFFSQ